MVSLPIPRDGLEDFRPWEANMRWVKVDQPWFGQTPEDASIHTERFLEAAFAKTAARGTLSYS